jgi:membrane fusion protein (multidrug efflux system)
MGLLYVFALFAALIGGLSWFKLVFFPQMIKTAIGSMPQPTQTVAVTEAKAESWAPRVSAIGTLRAVSGGDIAPQVGGVITALNFDRGQDVQKGAVLAQLDDSVEQADLKANLATLKNADVNLDRQKGLITGGNTPRSTLDQAQATRDTAAAAVDRSRALIAQKVILAPYSGRIGLRKADIGQYVAPGTSIANLQQLDPIYVDFTIPEQGLAAMKVGAEISFKVDAFPDRTFKGAIRAIDARVDAATRNVQVRGEAPNPDKILLPGMFANVDIAAGEPQKVVVIPRTGVSFSLYGDTVFVGKADAPAGDAQAAPADARIVTLDRRLVRVGDTREDQVAVLDGVSAGETVVTQGQLKLAPGMKVRVDNSSALPAPPSPRPKE